MCWNGVVINDLAQLIINKNLRFYCVIKNSLEKSQSKETVPSLGSTLDEPQIGSLSL